LTSVFTYSYPILDQSTPHDCIHSPRKIVLLFSCHYHNLSTGPLILTLFLISCMNPSTRNSCYIPFTSNTFNFFIVTTGHKEQRWRNFLDSSVQTFCLVRLILFRIPSTSTISIGYSRGQTSIFLKFKSRLPETHINALCTANIVQGWPVSAHGRIITRLQTAGEGSVPLPTTVRVGVICARRTNVVGTDECSSAGPKRTNLKNGVFAAYVGC
jgi:hypothetical protein